MSNIFWLVGCMSILLNSYLFVNFCLCKFWLSLALDHEGEADAQFHLRGRKVLLGYETYFSSDPFGDGDGSPEEGWDWDRLLLVNKNNMEKYYWQGFERYLQGREARERYPESSLSEENTVSGTAVPAVDVQPLREVYLGRLEAGKPQTVSFQLVPASPEMSLRLLPPEEDDGAADTTLSRNDDGTYTMELQFTPESSRRFVLLRRAIAIDWTEDLSPLEIIVRFTVAKDKDY